MLIFTLVYIIVSPLILPVATRRFSSGFRSVKHGPIGSTREEENSKEFSVEDEVEI